MYAPPDAPSLNGAGSNGSGSGTRSTVRDIPCDFRVTLRFAAFGLALRAQAANYDIAIIGEGHVGL